MCASILHHPFPSLLASSRVLSLQFPGDVTRLKSARESTRAFPSVVTSAHARLTAPHTKHTHTHTQMFSITATTSTAVVARRAAVNAPRRASRSAVLARADKSVSEALASADEAWKAQGETAETEQVMNIITDKIDPADGYVRDRDGDY